MVNYWRSEEGGWATVAEIERAGGTAMAWGADVADHEAVRRVAKALRETPGPVDILVNNAGVVTPRYFLETRPQEWRR